MQATGGCFDALFFLVFRQKCLPFFLVLIARFLVLLGHLGLHLRPASHGLGLHLTLKRFHAFLKLRFAEERRPASRRGFNPRCQGLDIDLDGLVRDFAANVHADAVAYLVFRGFQQRAFLRCLHRQSGAERRHHQQL